MSEQASESTGSTAPETPAKTKTKNRPVPPSELPQERTAGPGHEIQYSGAALAKAAESGPTAGALQALDKREPVEFDLPAGAVENPAAVEPVNVLDKQVGEEDPLGSGGLYMAAMNPSIPLGPTGNLPTGSPHAAQDYVNLDPATAPEGEKEE